VLAFGSSIKSVRLELSTPFLAIGLSIAKPSSNTFSITAIRLLWSGTLTNQHPQHQRRLQLLNSPTVAPHRHLEEQVSDATQALDQEEDKEDSLTALSEKHRVRRRTLLKHSSLLELLELPSLMDARVRSNRDDRDRKIRGWVCESTK